MKRLYKKSELSFALVWIGLYVAVMNIALQFCGGFDDLAGKTVPQVLKEDSKPATSESRMWLYASGEYCRNHIRIFEYQSGRSGKRPESFLKGFTGCLITDGYAGYNQVQQLMAFLDYGDVPISNSLAKM